MQIVTADQAAEKLIKLGFQGKPSSIAKKLRNLALKGKIPSCPGHPVQFIFDDVVANLFSKQSKN